MKKAFITFLAVISAMIMFTACGSNGSNGSNGSSDNSNGSDSNDSSADTASDTSAQDTTVSETEKASAATSGSDTAAKSLSSALDGTLWAGTDYRANRYAVGFNGNQAYFADNDSSVTEGYWTVNDDTLRIYRDEANTEKLLEIPLSYDIQKNMLILNEFAVMSQTDIAPDQVQEAFKQTSEACETAKLLQDSYWSAYNRRLGKSYPYFRCLTGAYNRKIRRLRRNTADYIWSIDKDNLCLYDDNYALKLTYGWQVSDNGSKITLSDADEQDDSDAADTSLEYTALTEEQSKDIVNCLLGIIADNKNK